MVGVFHLNISIIATTATTVTTTLWIFVIALVKMSSIGLIKDFSLNNNNTVNSSGDGVDLISNREEAEEEVVRSIGSGMGSHVVLRLNR